MSSIFSPPWWIVDTSQPSIVPNERIVKRYKQLILSNFFVSINALNHRHLVEANLDIESRGDRTLCTELLSGDHQYKVLTNELVPTVCPICAAILIRRINNMPLEAKINSKPMPHGQTVPVSQLPLHFPPCKDKEDTETSDEKESAIQFELTI